MEHKPNDRIDDFFKQAFEGADANPKEEQWNVPSDEVWEQIEAATQTDDKRRPLLLYWKWGAVAASLLLFMVVGAQAIQQQIKLNQQTSKIQHIEEQLHDLQKKEAETTTLDIDATVKNSTIVTRQTPTEEIATQKNTTKEVGKNIAQSTTPVKILPISNIETTGKAELSSEQELVLVEQNKDEIVAIDSSSEIETPKLESILLKEKNKQNKPIVALDGLASNIDLLQQTPIVPVMNRQNPPTQTNKQRPSITAFFAPVQSVQRFEKNRRNFFQSEVLSENALNVGLQFSYPLAKGLYAETGFAYATSSATREHRPRPKFLKGNERMNTNGDLESTYNITLLTSESVIETDVVLARVSTSAEPSNGSELDLVLTSNTNIKQLQIPFLLGYRIQQKRLGLDVKMGLIATAALENNVSLDNAKLNGQILRVNEVKNPQSRHFHKKNKVEPQLYVATALSYQFAENWAVQVEPYFSKSTKQRFLPRTSSSISAKSAGVKVGVRYVL